MYIHTFGGIFGIACSMVYVGNGRVKADQEANLRPGYKGNLFAFIGCLFLWMYWPSFNGALALGNAQHRVVVNTTLAMTCSCIGAFMVSALTRNGKFGMEEALNASLAGGVIIGSSSDLVVHGFVSMIIGVGGGAISALGFRYITPAFNHKGRPHDTCGVFNLHAVPGIIGGLIGAIAAGTAGEEAYGESISTIFPARGEGRNAFSQGYFQLAALGVSIGIAALSGAAFGFLLNMKPLWGTDHSEFNCFDDRSFWHVEEDMDDYPGMAGVTPTGGRPASRKIKDVPDKAHDMHTADNNKGKKSPSRKNSNNSQSNSEL